MTQGLSDLRPECWEFRPPVNPPLTKATTGSAHECILRGTVMARTDWLAELIEDIVEAVGPEHDPRFKHVLAALTLATYTDLGLVTPLWPAAGFVDIGLS